MLHKILQSADLHALFQKDNIIVAESSTHLHHFTIVETYQFIVLRPSFWFLNSRKNIPDPEFVPVKVGVAFDFQYLIDQTIGEDFIGVKPEDPLVRATFFGEADLVSDGRPIMKNKPSSKILRNLASLINTTRINNNDLISHKTSFLQRHRQPYRFVQRNIINRKGNHH